MTRCVQPSMDQWTWSLEEWRIHAHFEGACAAVQERQAIIRERVGV